MILPGEWQRHGRNRASVMAKPRNRPAKANTAYFEGVTPLWVRPGEPTIPERYHAACHSLADWVTSLLPTGSGGSWLDNDLTGFFPLRHYLIGACDRWHAYDWQADRDLIAARKRDAKHGETLAQTARAFRQAIGRSGFRRAERDLGLSIAAALFPDDQINMTYEDGCNAIVKALREFERNAVRPDNYQVRFGPLLYDTMPVRLPKREIAVALVLADLVTVKRKDEHRAGGNIFPRPPLLSPNLPWTAITKFATAYSCDQAELDHRTVTTSAKNLHRTVARILRHP